MLEEFFLKRRRINYENWQLGLLLIIVIISVVGFGALVEHAASDPYRSGVLAKSTLRIARIPADARKVAKEIIKNDHPTLSLIQRFEGQTGFQLDRSEDRAGDLLVLSRYDRDLGRSIVELADMENGDIIHQYTPDINAINARSDLKITEVNFARDRHPGRYMMTHPLLESDGSLVFQGMGTPLVKIDACSQVEWTLDGVFHHSIERGPGGNYWTAQQFMPSTVAFTSNDFIDDAIVKISQDGEILFQKSVGALLIENGLGHIVYTGNKYLPDPLHLNDVQPVFEDGPFWKRGDVFISLRHSSAVILYRPSANKVLWHQQGPWLAQHDVDIVSEHEISIFNNNTAVVPYGEYVIGSNELLIYDFKTEEVRSPYREGFRRNDVRTGTHGLSKILPNGDVFVEEHNFGRLLAMGTDGSLRWSYVNRASDQRTYHLQWSRYLSDEQARAARTALSNLECNR